MTKFHLYLDQRDLINLAEGRDDGLKTLLFKEISNGHVQIVLSLMHVVETWKYVDNKAKLNLAAYADSLSPIQLLFRSALFREEMLRAFYVFRGEEVETLFVAEHHQVDRSYPLSVEKHRIFSPFRKSVMEILSPTSVVNQIESCRNSFTQMLTFIEEDHRIVRLVSDVHDSYPDWSIHVKTKINGELPGKTKWLLGIVRSALGNINLERDEAEDFVHGLEITTCPAICVYLRIKDAINKDKTPTPHPSEMVDIAHAVAIPYCDAFSTDKRIWDYVRRCKISSQMFPEGYALFSTAFKSLASATISIEEWHATVNKQLTTDSTRTGFSSGVSKTAG